MVHPISTFTIENEVHQNVPSLSVYDQTDGFSMTKQSNFAKTEIKPYRSPYKRYTMRDQSPIFSSAGRAHLYPEVYPLEASHYSDAKGVPEKVEVLILVKIMNHKFRPSQILTMISDSSISKTQKAQ